MQTARPALHCLCGTTYPAEGPGGVGFCNAHFGAGWGLSPRLEGEITHPAPPPRPMALHGGFCPSSPIDAEFLAMSGVGERTKGGGTDKECLDGGNIHRPPEVVGGRHLGVRVVLQGERIVQEVVSVTK